MEQVTRRIIWEVHCRRHMWVDGVDNTDGDRLADVLTHAGWGPRPEPTVIRFHLHGHRPAAALLAMLTPDTERAADRWMEATALAEVLSRLVEGGPVVLVVGDIGRYIADNRFGFNRVRELCDVCVNTEVSIVALSSDTSHRDATLLRDKFGSIVYAGAGQ